ncbi:MAG: TetR/AcrR family transcriptional regulator [Phyllobacterium sp.]|uniref:TetR/AcrR family transcriptional regulator n=1 Tax=Phyllobacterium sp. TaxID=1871046 RepID=UPI0030F143A0
MAKTVKQTARRDRIEAAAYAVLHDVGYKSASLLAVARRAGASNETLYNWYENKQALFRSLVETNALHAKQQLEDSLAKNDDPLAALSALGPILLALVVSEKAVTLNRAAAGDVKDTATLGPAIAALGRNTIVPLLRELIARAERSNLIACEDSMEATEIYIRLLIGDLQIRRVIGVLDELSPHDIDKRAQQAFALFLRLYPRDAPTGKGTLE